MKLRLRVGMIATTALVLLGLSVGAAGAAASYFEVANGPNALIGEQSGAAVLTTNPHEEASSNFGCEVDPLTAYVFDNYAPATLRPAAPNMGCTAVGNSIPVDMNGCSFVFWVGQETAQGTYEGNVSVDDAYFNSCGSDGIRFYRYGAGGCWFGISPVQGQQGVVFREVPGDPDTLEVSMDQDFTVRYHQGVLCNIPEVNFRATWDVSSYSVDSGAGGDLGIYGTEDEWSPPSSTGHVTHFETYPYISTVNGSQGDEALTLTSTNTSIECGNVSLSRVSYTPSTSLVLPASYDGCTADVGTLHLPATIDMGNCRYVFNVNNSAAPYAGTMDLQCAAGAEGHIEVDVLNRPGTLAICTYEIAPQSGFDVGYANAGSGDSATVDLSLDAQGLRWTKTKGLLCTGNTSVNYTGDITLEAMDDTEQQVGISVK